MDAILGQNSMTQNLSSVIVGIDVGNRKSSVCFLESDSNRFEVIDIDTSADNIIGILDEKRVRIKFVGLESGSLSQHLAVSIRSNGFAVGIIDAQRAAPFLRSIKSAKTDNNDAYAVAELIRRRSHSLVWLKSDRSMKILSVYRMREAFIRSNKALQNTLIGLIRSSGLTIGTSRGRLFDKTVSGYVSSEILGGHFNDILYITSEL